MREKEAFWLIIKRLRLPILAIIVTFGVASLVLTIPEGIDAQGRPHHLSFFDAFYIISYTATTIGFGEIPYPLSYAQRIGMIITIYLTVPAWFYAIGTIISLLQDKTFIRSLRHLAFKRQIKRLNEPFVIICGYNRISRIIIDKLQEDGALRIVVLDKSQEKIDELMLEDYHPIIPALAQDATHSDILKDAGVANPFCKSLIVLFDNDDLNLKIAVKAKVINPSIMVIAESTFAAGIQNLQDVGVDHVIDPYERVAARIEFSLNVPYLFALLNWLNGGNLHVNKKDRLPRERYIICSRGRLGKAIKQVLIKNGIEYEILDINKETEKKDGSDRDLMIQANLMKAGCVIAGTPDDALNLSIILTARKLRPDIFVMVRENHMEENSVFASLRADKVFVMEKIIAHRAYNIVARPLVIRFVENLSIKSDDWGYHIVDRLTNIINKKPKITEVKITEASAFALCDYLKKGGSLTYRDVINNVDGEGRNLELVTLGVLYQTGEFVMGPSFDSTFAGGETLLIAGTDDAIEEFETIINNTKKLYFIIHKEEERRWIFRKLFPNVRS
jgi:Trk K+ transport system NAD-binding subunit